MKKNSLSFCYCFYTCIENQTKINTGSYGERLHFIALHYQNLEVYILQNFDKGLLFLEKGFLFLCKRLCKSCLEKTCILHPAHVIIHCFVCVDA